MAIDFSKINIGKDVAKDIRKMTSTPEFYTQVVKASAEVHIKSAQDFTWVTKAPDGSGFDRLSKGYRKQKYLETANPRPDLRYRRMSIDSMYTTQGQENKEAKVKFQRGADYMYDHQYGDPERKLPQRKIFPEEQDMSYPSQAENIRVITDILTRYINQPRIIIGG